MDGFFSWGGLIPLWIIGAPFAGALVLLGTLPKRSRSDSRDTRGIQPQQPMPTAGLSAQRM